MAGTKARSAVTTYLPHEEAERLVALARERDVPVAQLVRDAVRSEVLGDERAPGEALVVDGTADGTVLPAT